MRHAFLLLFALLAAACDNHYDQLLHELHTIRRVSDTAPARAQHMLDSIEMKVYLDGAEPLRHKYELLAVRLMDKSHHIDCTAGEMVALVRYFEDHGSVRERQEVYYYTARVFQQQGKTAKATDWFLRTVRLSERTKDSDPVVLQRAYSQLAWLKNATHDHATALFYARQERETAAATGRSKVFCAFNAGVAYAKLDSLPQARAAFCACLADIDSLDRVQTPYYIQTLLYHFSRLGDLAHATACYNRLRSAPRQAQNLSPRYHRALAAYATLCGDTDSAIAHLCAITHGPADLQMRYEALRDLVGAYNKRGDRTNANRCGQQLAGIIDSVGAQRRQETAGNLQNLHQLLQEREQERETLADREMLRNTLIGAFGGLVILVLAVVVYYVRRQNKLLHRVAQDAQEMKSSREEQLSLREELERRTEELRQTQAAVEQTNEELRQMSEEAAQNEAALKAARQRLRDKAEQNRMFVGLLRQSRLEEDAADVVANVRKYATGKGTMQATEWRDLYGAVENLQPGFHDMLAETLGKLTEAQTQLCYLMVIGVQRADIQRMVDMSRVTLWRWIKRLEPLLAAHRIV